MLGGEERQPTGEREETHSHGWAEMRRSRSVGREWVVMGGRRSGVPRFESGGDTRVGIAIGCSRFSGRSVEIISHMIY